MSILTEGFAAQAKALREFGYDDVTTQMVAEAHARWLKNETQPDIIGRFNESAFEDHPAIFGEKPE